MRLIAGLGNPGTRYIDTRHNIGFRVIDTLSKRHKARLKKKFFGNANEAGVNISGHSLLLIQPLTFMNLSGRCIFKYVQKLKISLDNLLIICDDINLPFGQIRIRPRGTAGGHNGLESVIKGLGTIDFPRLRIGIRTERPVDDLSEFVLSDFNKDEIEEMKEIVELAADACECWIREGIEKAMSLHNK